MDTISKAPDLAAPLYKSLMRFATMRDGKTDVTKVLLLLSGVMVETALVFDKPENAAQSMLERLSQTLQTPPNAGRLGYKALPPSAQIDQDIEKGRTIGRQLFEDWFECSFEFNRVLTIIIHDIFMAWENDGHKRADMLRLLSECVYRGMAYEIAAQELCDMIVERKIGISSWSLNESISALSAVAGQKLALSGQSCQFYGAYSILDDLDNMVYTMTQEAVRLGVPAGSDWRFGLAANDVPTSAPYSLIEALTPACDDFFAAICMENLEDQAVACAKAAGRMLAVTSGGEMPEIEPAIAKPLAMAAITDTYKSVCMDKQVAAE